MKYIISANHSGNCDLKVDTIRALRQVFPGLSLKEAANWFDNILTNGFYCVAWDRFCDDSDANFTLNALGVTISSGWGEPVDETKEEKPTFEGFRANLKAMVSDAITLQCFDEARVLIDILENLSGE